MPLVFAREKASTDNIDKIHYVPRVPHFRNPAFEAFASQINDELALAQVLIRRRGSSFELRHVVDAGASPENLENVPPDEVQSIAQFTEKNAFRPLKSAPNLRSSWRVVAANETELGYVLNHFYPGAVADWFVTQNGNPPVTNYREFTTRQGGMYRLTAKLSDVQAAEVARACCDKRFCLKRRLWTVEGLGSDSAAEKSLIPCLEPCAILLELARKDMRIEQEEKVILALSPSDAATIEAALQIALEHPSPDIREADFNAAANPRRLQLALEKLRAAGIKLANGREED